MSSRFISRTETTAGRSGGGWDSTPCCRVADASSISGGGLQPAGECSASSKELTRRTHRASSHARDPTGPDSGPGRDAVPAAPLLPRCAPAAAVGGCQALPLAELEELRSRSMRALCALCTALFPRVAPAMTGVGDRVLGV